MGRHEPPPGRGAHQKKYYGCTVHLTTGFPPHTHNATTVSPASKMAGYTLLHSPTRRSTVTITTACFLVLFTLVGIQFTYGFVDLSSWSAQKSPQQHYDKAYSDRDYRVLTSNRNALGFYNKIDVSATEYEMMNPTLLELPKGSKHDFLIIARDPVQEKKTIDGKEYKVSQQVATFANITYNSAGSPTLTAGKWARRLIEDFEKVTGPKHHCKNQPRMDIYIGPEDMKLFWTRKGEPLLIFTHQVDDEILCEGMFLIDARGAVPEFSRCSRLLRGRAGPHKIQETCRAATTSTTEGRGRRSSIPKRKELGSNTVTICGRERLDDDG